MMKITVKVEGMMCGMCESHVNNAVRRAYPAAKVTSSHKKGETVILAEAAPEEARLRQVIEAAGYTVGKITASPAEKKGLFGFLRR
ncbi:MAG: heavy-metal-associated domain-containing protein [Aristaeellaceae bacterium]